MKNSETENNPFFNPSIAQYNAVLNLEVQKMDKINAFKERIEGFKNIKTLKEAQSLAEKILPTASEINKFYVGDAKCIIINKKDILRISFDTPEEFICYNFV